MSVFLNNEYVTGIILPATLTSIGENASCCCRYLTSVDIPNTVTTIGRRAFFSCSELTSIVIPSSVTTIGEQAFVFCESLTKVVFKGANITIGDYMYGRWPGDGKLRDAYQANGAGTYTLSGNEWTFTPTK